MADINTHATVFLFIVSGIMSAFASLLHASWVGAVRADIALGFELDTIAILLLGGVGIACGRATLLGTPLSILIVLNLRTGTAMLGITGHTQTGMIGLLLLASVVAPRMDIGWPFSRHGMKTEEQ